MRVGIVLTMAAGREQNLALALRYVGLLTERPEAVVVVLDGPDATFPVGVALPRAPLFVVQTSAKHHPGMEQPRNVGVRELALARPEISHAWFLDSDICVEPGALGAYREVAEEVGYGAVLIGPYEFMPPGLEGPHPELRLDMRWDMFDERSPGPYVADLGVALGCFGGNLVWPVEEFIRIGGFHQMLHHGRCEDGELGLRAAAHQIPMALVPKARGYHVFHEIDTAAAIERNRRDVPLINHWHPWVEHKGLIVTDADGARFDYRCACGAQVNTLEMWAHAASHRDAPLILPDDLGA